MAEKKQPGETADNANEPSFEDAMQRLETLVDAMEQGDIPLADLVAKFEEGSKLLEACRARLKDAELKIEKLNVRTGDAEPFSEENTEG